MIELGRIRVTGMNERADLILPLGFEGAQNTRIFAVEGFDAAKLRGCSSVVTWVVARFNGPCKRRRTKTVSLYR
jgi:hypothetical protein